MTMTNHKKGYYGDFGGQFVPELLMPPLLELEEAMRTIVSSEAFKKELSHFINRKELAGRFIAILAICHVHFLQKKQKFQKHVKLLID